MSTYLLKLIEQPINNTIQLKTQEGNKVYESMLSCLRFFPSYFISDTNSVRLPTDQVFKVGRSPETCDLIISSLKISGLHFVLWAVVFDTTFEPLFYLKDLSLNGTFINNNLIGHNVIHLLEPGDNISIHEYQFQFVCMGKNPTVKEIFSIGDWSITSKVVGSGGFGRVCVATRKHNTKPFAVKIVKLKEQKYKHLKQEADLLSIIHHPNIIKVHESYCVKDTFFIFQDLVCGGDLFSFMSDGFRYIPVPEKEAITITYQLLKAIEFLHNNLEIMHRDLKLENVLLTSPSAGSKIIICDFGMAMRLTVNDEKPKTPIGTLEYSAPEVYNPELGHDHKCDIWSIGIIVHIILTGISPFDNEDQDYTKLMIQQHELAFDVPPWTMVNPSAISFVSTLLTKDPDTRPSVSQCLQHRWIVSHKEFLNKFYAKILDK